MPIQLEMEIAERLQDGIAIPACPLALTSNRQFDERRQRVLLRYYLAAGVGGIAVAVHTTQFAIREPRHGLFQPVLELTSDELTKQEQQLDRSIVRIGGIVGQTKQAVREAASLRDLRYHLGLLSLAGHAGSTIDQLIEHCRHVAEVIPLMGFYLQPAVGGCELPYEFWRRFLEIDNVAAIKIAAFNRYQTLDVIRALADSGRTDIALYTGNDDNIVNDLLTEFVVPTDQGKRRVVFSGGLLGHWACWTRRAVEMLEQCKTLRHESKLPKEMLTLAAEVTDCNDAFFDAANGFRGCIPGIHDVLRRQGLLEGVWCLDANETLSPGQAERIDRVYRSYPHLHDDAFVAEHLEQWLD